MKTVKDNKDAQEILREGKKTTFWRLIVEALNDSRVDIQEKQDGEDIASLPADKYKSQMELFKAKKELIDNHIGLPDSLVEHLGNPDNKKKNFDPYE